MANNIDSSDLTFFFFFYTYRKEWMGWNGDLNNARSVYPNINSNIQNLGSLFTEIKSSYKVYGKKLWLIPM